MVRSEQTRQFIIEKTASIFNKKGYTGTYLSDLTAATGLTKGSIYGNFKDKNEVALEAFKYNYNSVLETIRAHVGPYDRADEKLMAFLEAYKINHQVIFDNGGCAILNTSIDADDGNEILRNAVQKALMRWRNRLVEIIEDGIKNKELKPIVADDFALKMIAIIEGSIMIAKVLNEPEVMTKNMDAFKAEITSIKLD